MAKAQKGKTTKSIIWDASGVLRGKTEEALIAELKEQVKKFSFLRKDLDRFTPAMLKSALKDKEDIIVLINKIGGYYELVYFDDTTNSKILAKMTKFSDLSTDLSNEMIFFSLWFMHLDDKRAEVFLSSPELSEYKYYLHEIRKDKPYTKTEEIEKIILLKSVVGAGAHAQVYDLVSAGFKFELAGKKGLTQEEMTKNFMSPEPKLREEAYTSVLGKYKENNTVFAELYKNIVLDWSIESMKIRGYKSPISVRNLSNDIEDKTVETLLRVVRKNAGVFADYFKLKYELNKKKGAKYPFSRFHIYAPYPAKITNNYDFEKSKKIMLGIFSSFDKSFYDSALEIIDKKHVHVYPKQNKKIGAYCIGLHNKETPFIMLNHTGTLRDLFVVMHEFGHGVHDSLAKVQNNFMYHAALPICETASVFSEMMLSDKIIKESKNDDEKIAILIKHLDDQFATIIRQAYFVIFEIFAHDNMAKGLTREEFNKEYHKLLTEQFGKMEIPELFDEEWHYLPHIHHSPFYCYAYAWGNLLVLALFAMYRKEGDAFKKKYIRLLSSGGSKSPVDLLKEIGIDPAKEEFWEQGFTIIREEIDELKKLTKR